MRRFRKLARSRRNFNTVTKLDASRLAVISRRCAAISRLRRTAFGLPVKTAPCRSRLGMGLAFRASYRAVTARDRSSNELELGGVRSGPLLNFHVPEPHFNFTKRSYPPPRPAHAQD